MISSVYILPNQPLPIVCDFGWYYGSVGSPQRLAEAAFQVGTQSYPPGATVTAGQAVTLPTASPISVASTATLEKSGTIEFYGGLTQRTSATYTVLSSSTISCSGGSGTFGVGTPVFDPRFYVDPLPLGTTVVFDAIDLNNLGLPVTTTPSGVQIVSYQWDFGNGEIGFGPYATTIYPYSSPVPGLIVKLTVQDSLGRISSCAHRILLRSLTIIEGAAWREGAGAAR